MILTICPSIRPRRDEMIRSFKRTAHNAKLFIDDSDMTTVDIINRTFTRFPQYDHYHIANDDFIYETQGWDKILASDGISYGNDLVARENCCTAPVINGDIARCLGWLVLPGLTHLYGDRVLMDIGHGLNKLRYHKDVIIHHRHYMSEPDLYDSVYEKTNSKEAYALDEKVYREWRRNQMDEDIRRIRKEMGW